MSKHPIPDWLRSQFSRIEDDVRKLGPCGVFTQMRTVTQTYFEQQAAAPQPPALGGEPEILMSVRAVLGGLNGLCYETIKSLAAPTIHGKNLELIDLAHLAPLQAEIERLTAAQMEMAELYFLRGNEIDQLKARRDELEGLLLDLVTQHDLPIAARNLCNAALSAPAGSDQ